MERRTKTHVGLKKDSTNTLVGKYAKMGELHRDGGKPDADFICYIYPEKEDEMLLDAKSEKVSIKSRFPKRFVETTNLELEGELSVDGKTKLIRLTEENLKDHSVFLKETPSKYRVTAEYLSGLTATALKEFIKARPKLDAQIKLNLKRETILKELLNLLGLSENVIIESVISK